MKKSKVKIDMKTVENSARGIGNLLDGMRFPEVLSVLGTVIVELEYNAAEQGVDASPVLVDWLKGVETEIWEASDKLFRVDDTKELN